MNGPSMAGADATASVNAALGVSMKQRQINKKEREELLRWAAAHNLGDAELAILHMWGVTNLEAVRSLRGTKMDVLFPPSSGWLATVRDFFAVGRPSEESKARLFKALNKKSSVRQKKDEL